MYKRKKGMSLIVLVITILVMIVLAGVVVMGLANNNPMSKATEAVFKSDMANIKATVAMDMATKVGKGEASKTTDLNGPISNFGVSDSIAEKYKDIVRIENGELVLTIGLTSTEKNREMVTWGNDIGLYVSSTYVTGGYDGFINTPELTEGLIPVRYIEGELGNKWVVASITNSDVYSLWYDYKNQMWANAVTLNESSELRSILIDPLTNKVDPRRVANYQGFEINMSEVTSMWVWIPSFSYQPVTATNQQAGVNIKFADGTKEPDVHPAFKFGEKTLKGFWFAKFESSYVNSRYEVKPDVLAYKAVATAKSVFDGVRQMEGINSNHYGFSQATMYDQATGLFGEDENHLDIHVARNMDWGAIALLSNSIYGKYGNLAYSGEAEKEVTINNSNYSANAQVTITGRSAGSSTNASALAGGSYTYEGKDAATSEFVANRNLGYAASTTGNITGIYDMSGGNYDMVMGVLTLNGAGCSTDKSGYYQNATLSLPDPRYYTEYTTGAVIEGDANLGWYSDYKSNPNNNYAAWILRGGNLFSSGKAGIFATYSNCGGAAGGTHPYGSPRLAITIDNE